MKVSDLYLRDFTKDFNMVLIFLRGFKRFCKVSENKNGIRWKCIRKRQGCRSFLVTDHKVEEILAQGYMKHTCRKTKKEKQKSKESKQRIKEIFKKHGQSPRRNLKTASNIYDFGNLSNILSSLNHVQKKKVSFQEPPVQKPPTDPKEYIDDYFKRTDSHFSLNEIEASRQNVQPQDFGVVIDEKVNSIDIQQQQSPLMNTQCDKMRSVLQIPKIEYAAPSLITDFFKRQESRRDEQVVVRAPQTDFERPQLSESTLLYLRKIMKNDE